MDTPVVKVVTGHRRVGKSFILLELINLIKSKEKNANIIYINKEDAVAGYKLQSEQND